MTEKQNAEYELHLTKLIERIGSVTFIDEDEFYEDLDSEDIFILIDNGIVARCERTDMWKVQI